MTAGDIGSFGMDPEYFFGIFFITQDDIAASYQIWHYLRSGFSIFPKIFPEVQIAGNGDSFFIGLLDSFQANLSKIGRASCGERVCKYVSISGAAVPLKKK